MTRLFLCLLVLVAMTGCDYRKGVPNYFLGAALRCFEGRQQERITGTDFWTDSIDRSGKVQHTIKCYEERP